MSGSPIDRFRSINYDDINFTSLSLYDDRIAVAFVVHNVASSSPSPLVHIKHGVRVPLAGND